MKKIFAAWSLRTRVLALVGAALVLVVASMLLRGRRAFDPLVSAPLLAMESVTAKSLYFNGAAHPWLKAKRPELLPAAASDATSAMARSFAQAVQSPKLFRQLDRQFRFDAVLLVGSTTEYRPLLDHLCEAKDFTLAYVDHWAIVFHRDAPRPWQLADFATVRERIGKLTSRDRAECLAETGVKLVALRRLDEAQTLLDEARNVDANSAHAWNGLAVLHMQRGRWKEALAASDRALKEEPHALYALATKTQLLYATKHFSEAYEASKRLLERMPNEPGILFYHAKICHEAHAYVEEIRALEQLIALAETDKRPTGGYHLYLAQAYAETSDAERSVAAFNKALADPELPADQRKFAEESIARIKSRVSL